MFNCRAVMTKPYLIVQLLASDGSVSDSLTVVYYTDDSAKIEQVEFADGTVLWSCKRLRPGSDKRRYQVMTIYMA